MQKITTAAELKTAIKELEAIQANELSLIKGDFLHICDSLQPVNLLKNSFKSIIASPGLKDNIIDTSIGLAAGLLSKAIIIGTSHNPIKKLLGTVLQAGVTNTTAKHTETIKMLAGKVANLFRKKKPEKTTAGNLSEY